jgi:hypothetical protein
MNGAVFLLAAVLLLYGTSLLVIRFTTGKLRLVTEPITWFYFSWIVGLVMLSLPLFEYQEKITEETFVYIFSVLAAFSIGAAASIFIRNSIGLQVPVRIQASEELDRIATLAKWLLILGLIGTLLLVVNALLSGSLSVADRLDSENAARVRSAALEQGDSKIGPLYGIATFSSAVGGLGVSLVMYFIGKETLSGHRYLKWLAVAVLVLNFFAAFVAFSSRMFAVFSMVIGLLSFVFGRWSDGLKVIAYKLTIKRFIVLMCGAAITLSAAWFGATYFLEKRVAGQSPSVLLYKTHRANFDKSLYDLIRKDTALQYFAFSASYFSTPIPTLAFYLDLPSDRYPGPFWGQYDFPAVARWVRRAAFIPDPYFWENARLEIFKPLGDINFGTNVWSTAPRDLIADFGKIGSIVFLFVAGFLSQTLSAAQKRSPSALKAGLMAYVCITLLFSGFISTLFMPQIHWPMYFAVFLLFTRFNKLTSPKSQSRQKFVRQGARA